jgi:prepilin peptidase CpaA
MNNFTPQMLATFVIAILSGLLLYATWRDVQANKIPNKLVFLGALLGLLLNSVLPEGFGFTSQTPGAIGFTSALAGLGLGLALLLPFYMLRTLGAGDVKLMAMVGAFVGPSPIFNIMLFTLVIGGLLAIIIALKHGVVQPMLGNLKQMAWGSYFKLAMHEMPNMEGMPKTAAKMPYAIAISAGTFMYIFLAHRGHMPLFNIF